MRRSILLTALVSAMVAAPIGAYASHRFNDVSNSHTFHNAIQWMADNGITVGCNQAGTEYCPEDNVTRGQMSAFMKRLAENRVVDAATLEGNTVAGLVPRATFNATNDAPDGQSLVLPAEITAPAPGILILSGGVNAANLAADDSYVCQLRIDGEIVPGTRMFSEINGTGDINEEEDCTTTGAAMVSAGTYTIDLQLAGVAADTVLVGASVWGLWVPVDGTGSIPSSLTQLGDPTDFDELTEDRDNG